MQCAKCGTDLPQGTRQCPNCGMANEFVETKKKVKPIYWVVAGLTLIAIVSIAFAAVMSARARSITQAPGANLPSGSVVAAPPGQPAGGNITSAPPGSPAPGMTNPPGVTKPKPPKAVVDYLEHVKKVEAHRQMLLKDTGDALMLSATSQTMSLLKMIDMASDPNSNENTDPLEDSKKELARQYKNWLSTLKYFDEKPAPNECREFSGAYRQVLYNETKTIGDIAVSMSGVDMTDPQDMQKLLGALQKMKGDPRIQANIDASTDNADAKLTQLVSNYDMQKPFDVPREQKTSGSIMGF